MEEKKKRRISILKISDGNDRNKKSENSLRPKKRVSFAPPPPSLRLSSSKMGQTLLYGETDKENNIAADSREMSRLLEGRIIGSSDLCNMFTEETNEDTFKDTMMPDFNKSIDFVNKFLTTGDKRIRKSQIGSMMLDNSFSAKTPNPESPYNLRRSPRIKSQALKDKNTSTNKVLDFSISEPQPMDISVVNTTANTDSIKNTLSKPVLTDGSDSMIKKRNNKKNASFSSSQPRKDTTQVMDMDISDSFTNNVTSLPLLSGSILASFLDDQKITPQICASSKVEEVKPSNLPLAQPPQPDETSILKVSMEIVEPPPAAIPSNDEELKSMIMETSQLIKVPEDDFDEDYSQRIISEAKEHCDKISNIGQDLNVFFNMSMTECIDITNQSNMSPNFTQDFYSNEKNYNFNPEPDEKKLVEIKTEIFEIKKFVEAQLNKIKGQKKQKTRDLNKSLSESLSEFENSRNCFLTQLVAFKNYKTNITRNFEDALFNKKKSSSKLKLVTQATLNDKVFSFKDKLEKLYRTHEITFGIISTHKFFVLIQHGTVSSVFEVDGEFSIKNHDVKVSEISDPFFSYILKLINPSIIDRKAKECHTLEDLGSFYIILNNCFKKLLKLINQIEEIHKTGFPVAYEKQNFGFRVFIRGISHSIIWICPSVSLELDIDFSLVSVEHICGHDFTSSLKSLVESFLNHNKFSFSDFVKFLADCPKNLYDQHYYSDL